MIVRKENGVGGGLIESAIVYIVVIRSFDSFLG